MLYLLAIRAIVSPSPRLRGEGRDEGASPRGCKIVDSAPSCRRVPGRAGQSRSRPERLPHGSTSRRRTGHTGSAPDCSRPAVRIARLQTAVRIDNSVGARRGWVLAHFRRRGGDSRVPCCGGHHSHSARMCGAPSSTPRTSCAPSCSSRAIPAGTRLKPVRVGAHVGRTNSAGLRFASDACDVPRCRSDLAMAKQHSLMRSRQRLSVSATILATPFTFDYDMMVLAPAIAFFAADGMVRGFRPWEKTALAALWLVPLVARSTAQLTLIPLGVPVMLVTFILLLRRSTLHFAQPMALSTDFF